MPLYHVKRAGLSVGDQIPVLVGQKLSTGSGLERRERVVESVRAPDFPALPSRYACTFAWAELDPAIAWLPAKPEEPTNSIYEVAAVGALRWFRGDARWLDGYADPHHDEAHWRWAARNYWAGAKCPWGSSWEIAIEGPLIVVRVVATPSEGAAEAV